jgi:hypothetical protein
MEWFLGCVASRLVALPMVITQLSMIHNYSYSKFNNIAHTVYICDIIWSWPNRTHVKYFKWFLVQSNYIPTCFGGSHHHHYKIMNNCSCTGLWWSLWFLFGLKSSLMDLSLWFALMAVRMMQYCQVRYGYSWVCVYMCALFEKLYFPDHDT